MEFMGKTQCLCGFFHDSQKISYLEFMAIIPLINNILLLYKCITLNKKEFYNLQSILYCYQYDTIANNSK